MVCDFKEEAIVFGDESGRVFLVEERYENRFEHEDMEAKTSRRRKKPPYGTFEKTEGMKIYSEINIY